MTSPARRGRWSVALITLLVLAGCGSPDAPLPGDRALHAGLRSVLAGHRATEADRTDKRYYLTLDSCPLGRLPLQGGSPETQLTYLEHDQQRIVCSAAGGGFVMITIRSPAEFQEAIGHEDGQLSIPKDAYGGQLFTVLNATECEAIWTRPGSRFAFTAYVYRANREGLCADRLKAALPVMTHALAAAGP
ncbi:MAG: hypothetical protein ACJ72D_13790 [Marmoricola sp.]